jgi:uncharacterized protein
MHYYIDGYNLLFRFSWTHTSDNLEKSRLHLLEDLNEKASFLHLQFTCVFDAPQQTDEMRRSHFHSLEIIFTSYGQTADDLIIEILEHHKKPQDVILVSSDRSLQRRAKALKVRVESIEEFLANLQKKWIKKRNKQKDAQFNVLKYVPDTKAKPPIQVKEAAAAPKKPSLELKTQAKPEKANGKKKILPPLSDLAKWEKLFQDHLQDEDDL